MMCDTHYEREDYEKAVIEGNPLRCSQKECKGFVQPEILFAANQSEKFASKLFDRTKERESTFKDKPIDLLLSIGTTTHYVDDQISKSPQYLVICPTKSYRMTSIAPPQPDTVNSVFIFGGFRPDDDSDNPFQEDIIEGMKAQKAIVKGAQLYCKFHAYVKLEQW